jgi:15-cis-phytoene synthase
MSSAVQPAPVPFVPTESQLAIAYSVCRGIARTAARNFYYAFLVLPKRKQNAVCAVYAFMRRCDDITDDTSIPLSDRRTRLAQWLDSLHRAQAGYGTDDPILLALSDAQHRYKIPAELLDQLAYGTGMDVQEPVSNDTALSTRYQTFEDLYLYCYRVAAVVGLVCIRVFGYRDAAAEPLAERCGLAFQLTNIIRDVKEDAAMGRIYLPQADLQEFGLAAEELLGPVDAKRFQPLLALEADRAREFYRAAADLIPLIDEDSQPALWVLVNIYRALLEKIAQRNYDVFSSKVRLTTFEKVRILGKGFLRRLT